MNFNRMEHTEWLFDRTTIIKKSFRESGDKLKLYNVIKIRPKIMK